MILNQNNGWKGSFDNLVVYANGKEIVYTVKELEAKGYTSVVTGNSQIGYVITNTHVPETIEVRGTKTWNDANNQDGKRPESITINLLADNEKVDEKVVTEKDNWAWSFENLPKYKEGQEIKYTITEEPVPEYAVEINGFDVINSYTPGETSRTVVKKWEDNNNQDGIRPEKITVQLYADGTAKGDPAELNAENNWTYIWNNLPEKAEGKDITYTVKEIETVEGYTTSYSEDTFTITNTHAPSKIDVEGTKTWADNNETGKRPESITIHLFADGVEVDKTTAAASDNWAWSFKGLDEFKNGTKIVYTVTEDSVDGYITKVDGYEITNTITTVSVSKVDVTNGEELEGAHIQILDKDGNVVEEWDSTLEAHKVTGLKTGETYTLRETVAPEGYKITQDTTFELNEDGSIGEKTTATIGENGVLLVEDEPTEKTGIIRVTKELTEDGDPLNAVNQTFYVALYEDEECTKRVTDIKPVVFERASASTVEFTGMEVGKDYYVGETDENGNVIQFGNVGDAVFMANFAEGNHAVIEEADGSVTVIFENEFRTMPDGFYKDGKLTITKELLGADGEAKNSNETFYAGIFADAEYTQLTDQTNINGEIVNVVALNLNGGSTASVTVNVVVGAEPQVLYVTEVDEDGIPVAGAPGFEYTVSIDKTEVSLNLDHLEETVVITNKEDVPETESETETETETEKPKTPVKTGDDTPIVPFATAFLGAALVLVAAISRRRRKGKN